MFVEPTALFSPHLGDYCLTVMCKLVISGQNSVSYGNERIWGTSKYKLEFDTVYVNEVNKKTAGE